MPMKCAYLPERLINKLHWCISGMGQQTCSAVYRPKQWCIALLLEAVDPVFQASSPCGLDNQCCSSRVIID